MPEAGTPERLAEPYRAAGLEAEATLLQDLSPQQWRTGIAAWLGWTFDGLDMHLYTLVAAPFVAQLLGAATPLIRAWAVTARSSRAAFCWAGRWAAGSSGVSATGWAGRAR